MKRPHQLYLSILAIFAVLYTPLSDAESSVWVVEKGDFKLYLGGTLHLLSAEDFPLPEEYDRAYSQSSTLVFEADISQAQTTQGQAKAMSAMMYKDGRTLDSVLQPDTYAQLETYLLSKGLPMAVLNQFTAGGISVTISALEMQTLGLTEAGVDQYFMSKAAADNKPSLYLETLEAQLQFIATLGDGHEDELISYTLADLKRMPTLLADMRTQWRHGDIAGMDASMIDELRQQFPTAYHSLMVERNHAWMPQIEHMMQNSEIEFILVGAAHLAGKDGLIRLLLDKDYKVWQF